MAKKNGNHKKLMVAYIQWDVRSWSKALRYWDKTVNWNNINTCLELGARQGGLSLWLALKGKHVICSDIDKTEENAKPLHIKYSVSTLISYQNIDATNIPYENYFDLIIFKSVIGGIGSKYDYLHQQKAFDEILKALKPDGVLLFAENLTGSIFHRFLRKKYVKWGGTWLYISLDNMKNFLSKFSSSEVKTTGVTALLGRTERQRSVLASLDNVLFNHIILPKGKYIAYGIAKK